MSGSGTFAGTDYQAGVIAYISVHMLLEQRLGWFPTLPDAPIAVSGEVDGPGDDVSVALSGERPSVEVQVKHGLTGVAELLFVVARIKEFSGNCEVVLAVDGTSSRWLADTLADDLDRFRQGRHDSTRQHTREVLAALQGDPAGLAALQRLHIKRIDVDALDDAGAKWAVTELRKVPRWR